MEEGIFVDRLTTRCLIGQRFGLLMLIFWLGQLSVRDLRINTLRTSINQRPLFLKCVANEVMSTAGSLVAQN